MKTDAFKIMRAENLRKWNAQRRAISQPDIDDLPILPKAAVMFTTSAEMEEQPASCANCIFYNEGRSCQLIGPHIKVKKFIYPAEATSDSKPIEYWPCCGMHQFGTSHSGGEKFLAANDPGELGLVWINAPRVGLPHGGANCGGQNGGDDCDHYMTDVAEKRDAPTGLCRVLQAVVCNGDICTAWADDDQVQWNQAQAILDELDGK